MNKVRLHNDTFTYTGFDNVKLGSNLNYDAGEVDELWLDDVLSGIPIEKVDDAFRDFVRLVKRGGKLIVNGTDIYEVCKAMTSYNISIAEANFLLYGSGNRNCYSISFVAETLKGLGLKVVSKRISDFKYSVEATR